MNKQVFTSTAAKPFLAIVFTAAIMGSAELPTTTLMATTGPMPAELMVRALIEKDEGIVGGSARIARTRIPVWTLENYRRLGAINEKLLEAFPSLRTVDLEAAWAYVASNGVQIEKDIRENDA